MGMYDKDQWLHYVNNYFLTGYIQYMLHLILRKLNEMSCKIFKLY